MKIKIFLITLLFTGVLNAAFGKRKLDYQESLPWRKSLMKEQLWQKDKEVIARLKKGNKQYLEKLCPGLTTNVDRATIEQALIKLTPAKKNELLREAISHNVPFIAEYLLKHGADVNVQDNDNMGYTPLHLAAENGYTEIVQLLLYNHADINAKNTSYYTPLHLAAVNGHTEVVRLLLKHSADVNAKSKYGFTPLYWAARNGHTEVMRLLIAYGADVDAKNLLHKAALNGWAEVVELLLESGSDRTITDNAGNTPADVAKTDEIRRLIIDHKKAGPAGE